MNAFNRVLWLVVGVCATAVGAIGLGIILELWSVSTIDSAIPFRDVWQDWRAVDWSQPGARWVLLAAGAAVAVVAVAVAARQLVPAGAHERGDELVIEEGTRGRTVVSRAGIARAAEAEARATSGVEDARVDNITVTPDGVHARYRLTVDGAQDIPHAGADVIARGGRSLARMLERTDHRLTAQVAVRHTPHTREVR